MKQKHIYDPHTANNMEIFPISTIQPIWHKYSNSMPLDFRTLQISTVHKQYVVDVKLNIAL